MRPSGRRPDELRPVTITRHVSKHAEGSVLVGFGDTRVICTASVEERVPGFKRGSGSGWVTAEYGMLPRATHTRNSREAASGRQGGRTLEIQRLIGRALRAVVDLSALGERTVTLDCDVIQADGGTRTAAITGAYVALVDAVASLRKRRAVTRDPIHGAIAAVSVGIFGGQPVLDLDYAEDSTAETDMNLVINDAGAFVEIQGTAEGHAFRNDELQQMLALGQQGVAELIALQRAALEGLMHLVLASGNRGKLAELRGLLADLPLTLASLADFTAEAAEETAPTFVENAILKARFAAQASGLPALADDSGLEVDALAGAPGVRSARFAGPDADDAANRRLLLERLADVPPDARAARFRCVLVYLRHADDPWPEIFTGTWEGEIALLEAGENGFGYDPLFRLPALGRTAAQLDPADKARLSHRAQATAALRAFLRDQLARA